MLERPVALLCGLTLTVTLIAVTVCLWPAGKSSQPTDSGPTDVSAPLAFSWTPPTADGFVGSQACVECHAEISATYAQHPMALSFRTIDEFDWSTYPIDMQHRVTGGRTVLEVRSHEDALIHHEIVLARDGTELFDSVHEMSYVAGSGQRALAFLERRGDALFMSPLNWYAKTNSWGRAPSYQPDDPRRFDRRVHDQCIACHSGIPAARHQRANAFPRIDSHEMSIGCEKCHGPGAEHIAWHRGRETMDASRDPIVNPAQLPARERESVCYQCHLQGVARIQRPLRSDFDFRPGQSYEEIWTVLVADAGVGADGRTRAINHVTQLHDSRCFKSSEGALGCISCHDPHRIPSAEERISFYRERCLKCHSDVDCGLDSSERELQQNSCIACHMPTRDASNVSHVSQTDHRIIRSIAAQGVNSGDLPDGSQPKMSLSFFDAADRRLPEWERSRALGLGAWLYLRKNGTRSPESLAAEFQKALDVWPEDGDVLTTFAALQMEHGHFEEALRLHQAARGLPQSREEALEGCVQSSYLLARWNLVVSFADELLSIESSSASVHAMRADALWNLDRKDEAIEAAREAIKLNPLLNPVRQWLIDKLGQTGHADDARREEQLLQQILSVQTPARSD